MISIQTTDTFDAWFAGLKDKRASTGLSSVFRTARHRTGDPTGGWRQVHTEQGYQDRATTGGKIVGGRHDIEVAQMG
jgi:hypothetical protein